MARNKQSGIELYGSHMGNRGVPERRRLKVGDLLPDGTRWTGNYKAVTLEQRRQNLVISIAKLQKELTEVEQQLGIVEEESISQSGEAALPNKKEADDDQEPVSQTQKKAVKGNRRRERSNDNE
jgi:hypothetical protein